MSRADTTGPASGTARTASGDPATASVDAVSMAGEGQADEAVRPGRRPWDGWDRMIRVAGVVVSIVAAFVTGAVELLLSTLRAGDLATVWRGDAIGSGGGPLLGLSILMAAVGNYAIAWFAVGTTGRRWALGPPWALWTLLMLFAASVRTSEGDYLLGGDNWVALGMILVGSLAFAVYSYRMILKRSPA